jgi:hypothetical protein
MQCSGVSHDPLLWLAEPGGICHVRLESLGGAENPYSLMQVFGRGHQITRNEATVYITNC